MGGEAGDRGERQEAAGEAALDEAEAVVEEQCASAKSFGYLTARAMVIAHGPRDQGNPGPHSNLRMRRRF